MQRKANLSLPSSYFGHATLEKIKVRPFDSEISLINDDKHCVEFAIGDAHKSVIKNYCVDSKFVGLYSDKQVCGAIENYPNKEICISSNITVVNGETGEIVFSKVVNQSVKVQLYDNILVVRLVSDVLSI